MMNFAVSKAKRSPSLLSVPHLCHSVNRVEESQTKPTGSCWLCYEVRLVSTYGENQVKFRISALPFSLIIFLTIFPRVT